MAQQVTWSSGTAQTRQSWGRPAAARCSRPVSAINMLWYIRGTKCYRSYVRGAQVRLLFAAAVLGGNADSTDGVDEPRAVRVEHDLGVVVPRRQGDVLHVERPDRGAADGVDDLAVRGPGAEVAGALGAGDIAHGGEECVVDSSLGVLHGVAAPCGRGGLVRA